MKEKEEIRSEDISEDDYILRKQLQILDNDIYEDIRSYKNNCFGRVSTIVEAIISDKEQLKSIKDLLSDAIYCGTFNVSESINSKIKTLAKAHGMELYDNLAEPVNPINRYEIK